ncbi:cupin domain-containing protein [Caldimonas sp. KR1-144]|uniref:cupin domain-containing protein n=1 Tax=Caldimonas sp. KR1-144 TaxID=3400911 RepID=UPI003C05CE42
MRFTPSLLFVAALAVGTAAHAQTAAHAHDAPLPSAWQTGIKRSDLVKKDLHAPGIEVIQARVDIDPGVASPRHSHPGEEVAYVLEGSFEYQLEGRAPIVLKKGESLFIPAGVPHVARNVGTGVASELATYIVRKGAALVVQE